MSLNDAPTNISTGACQSSQAILLQRQAVKMAFKKIFFLLIFYCCKVQRHLQNPKMDRLLMLVMYDQHRQLIQSHYKSIGITSL
jgi:hypothetical protein